MGESLRTWTGALAGSANAIAALGAAIAGISGGAETSIGEARAEGGFDSTVGRSLVASTVKSSASTGGGAGANVAGRRGQSNPVSPTPAHVHHKTSVLTGNMPASC